MKTLKAFTILILIVSLSATFACSNKDDNPKPTAIVNLPAAVITTYKGSLSYSGKDGTVKANGDDGTATITKNGSNYTITFSDGVPALSGLSFIANSGDYASVGENGSVAGVSIRSSRIDISVTMDGNVWGFSGTK